MKYQLHVHVLSHLVRQHNLQPKSNFSFSEHVPLDEQTIRSSHKQRLLNQLEEELIEMKQLLHKIPTHTHRRDVFEKKIEYLSQVISEKKN